MNPRTAIFLLILSLVLSSCGALKRKLPGSPGAEKTSMEKRNDLPAPSRLAVKISENAKEFLGTRYKYGGTTNKGMDCSGLVYTAFQKEEIHLPRVSREMSLLGERLYLKEVNVGDLLFFETDKNRKVINHVGLVVEAGGQDIFFIHSSTSRGVIISSLSNPYWTSHFVMARRVLLE